MPCRSRPARLEVCVRWRFSPISMAALVCEIDCWSPVPTGVVVLLEASATRRPGLGGDVGVLAGCGDASGSCWAVMSVVVATAGARATCTYLRRWGGVEWSGVGGCECVLLCFHSYVRARARAHTHTRSLSLSRARARIVPAHRSSTSTRSRAHTHTHTHSSRTSGPLKDGN